MKCDVGFQIGVGEVPKMGKWKRRNTRALYDCVLRSTFGGCCCPLRVVTLSPCPESKINDNTDFMALYLSVSKQK